MIIAQISNARLISVSSKLKVIEESRIKYSKNFVLNILKSAGIVSEKILV